MAKLTLTTFVTLDGVMQAPGARDAARCSVSGPGMRATLRASRADRGGATWAAT